MSSSTLEKFIPTFDGSNFLEWKAQMTAYLQERGYWQIVNGTITQPVAPPATAAEIEAWDVKDEMANRSITLRLAHSLCTGIVGATLHATFE